MCLTVALWFTVNPGALFNGISESHDVKGFKITRIQTSQECQTSRIYVFLKKQEATPCLSLPAVFDNNTHFGNAECRIQT